MKPIRILAIAPYKGMEKLLNQIAQELEDIDLQVEDLTGGTKRSHYGQDGDYEFIISRHETLQMVEQETHIPIVEISLSEYDILHAIRIAKGFPEKFCVVGSPDLTARIKTLCDLMELNITVSIIDDPNETEDRIQELKKKGCNRIVGDVDAVNTAKKMQLQGILIISGRESILAALKGCKKLHNTLEEARNKTVLLKQILDPCPMYIFAYNRQGELFYSNAKKTNGGEDPGALERILPPLVEQVFEKAELRILRRSGGFIWNLHCLRIAPQIVCFYVRSGMEMGNQDASLSIQDDFSGNTSIMQSYYLESSAMGSVIAKAKQISRSEYPVLLAGEPGTGKNTLAFAIHRQSKFQNSTFLIVNCQLITEKELHTLLEDEGSPLGENNIGIHFRDIHYLSPKAQELLIAYIKETDLHRRNRIIYTYSLSFAGKEEHHLLKYLKNERECDCLTLLIPPLREHKEDIPDLAKLYINELNSNYGKQIVGLESKSLEILTEYDWPENLGQFIRVMQDLALNTEGTYIKEEDAKAVIVKEKQLTGENRNFISLQGSLDKIISDIIWQVFKEEGANQCRTAERLGVSRSTIWRKLKERL